tara:strand:- start:476 stop:658 length:183 start_codon:yes stop_codon:yes gene_type:complete
VYTVAEMVEVQDLEILLQVLTPAIMVGMEALPVVGVLLENMDEAVRLVGLVVLVVEAKYE